MLVSYCCSTMDKKTVFTMSSLAKWETFWIKLVASLSDTVFLCVSSFVGCCWFFWYDSCGDPRTQTSPNRSPANGTTANVWRQHSTSSSVSLSVLLSLCESDWRLIAMWTNYLTATGSSQSCELSNALFLILMEVPSGWLPVAPTRRLRQLHICCLPAPPLPPSLHSHFTSVFFLFPSTFLFN